MNVISTLTMWLLAEASEPSRPRHNGDELNPPSINPSCVVLAVVGVIAIILYVRARRRPPPGNSGW